MKIYLRDLFLMSIVRSAVLNFLAKLTNTQLLKLLYQIYTTKIDR